MSEQIYDHQTDGVPGEFRPYDYGIDDTRPFQADPVPIGAAVDTKPGIFHREGLATAAVVAAGYIVAYTTLMVVLPDPGRAKSEQTLIREAPACPAPSPEAYRSTRAVLASPPPWWGNEQTVADKLGVTLYQAQGRETVRALQSMRDDTVTGFDQLLARTNQYMKRYGIKVSKATKENEADGETFHPPTPSELTKPETQEAMVNLARGFTTSPVEYVKFSGVKNIIIVANQRSTTGAYVTPGPDPIIRYNVVTKFGTAPNMMPHEVFHPVDEKLCGGYYSQYKDPAFTRINLWDIYNHPGNVGLLDQPGHIDKNAPEVQVTDDYSLTNVAEDKANLAAEFAGEYDVFDPAYPLLRQKAELLLARLAMRLPKVAQYFASIRNSSQEINQSDIHP